jgi:two-component system cell cycle sensor histidine kinase/response regulator CckA
VGRLAGGIAHDINNMLMPILGYTEMLADKIPAGDDRREDLAEIASAATRVKEMTQRLLAFARKQTLDMAQLDLNAVVSGFSRMLRMTLRENIAIKMQLASAAGFIVGDRGQLEQVILNLAVNAQDAMPGEGTFTLTTGDAVIDSTYAASRPGLSPGAYVQLTAGDTGTGMNAETLSKIFDPFFTTKESGKGTGLGLAMVYGITKQHGGYIEVKSEQGGGTEFTILLPASHASAEDADVSPMAREQKGTETILVVEDQEQVLRLVSLMLGERGYRVLTALSGREALEKAGSFAGEIHLLATDVIMPQMNGKELYERLRAVRSGIKVLYLSGYSADVISSQGVLDSGVNFLRKPFSVHELTAKVRQVLDDGR